MVAEGRPREASGRWARLFGAFVGRRTEVAVFQELLNDLASGTGALVLVSGEPGIGKSTLLRRFAMMSQTAGVPLVRDLTGTPRVTDEDPGDAAHSVRAGPTAVVHLIDDLHLATREELDGIRAAIHRTSVSPLLIAAAYRDASPARSERLDAFVARATHDLPVVRLPLGGLSPTEVGEYLSAILGHRTTDPDTIASVHGRTAGNPFLVRELMSLVVSTPEAPLRTVLNGVPDGVRDVVKSRLADLSPPVRATLAAAAVAGFEIDIPLLSEATLTPVADLLSLVSAAESAGFIQFSPERASYRFAHQLTHDAVLDALSLADRVTLHVDTGFALERLVVGATESRLPDLARHFVAAARVVPAHRTRAVRYSWLAARQATDRGRWEEAAMAYQAAAEFIGAGRVPDSGADRTDCLIAAGQSWEAAGEARKAWREFMHAASECRRLGDHLRFAHVVLIALRDIDVPRQRRVQLTDDALAAVRHTDAALAARLLAARAANDDTPDAHAAAAEARTLAADLDLPDVEGRLARRDFVHALGRGELDAVRSRLIDDSGGVPHDLDPVARAIRDLDLAETHVRGGDFTRALGIAEPALHLAVKSHAQPVAGRARLFLASMALAAGDLSGFDRIARELRDRPVDRQLLVRRAELAGQLVTAANLIPAPTASGADHPRIQWDLAGTRARISLLSGDRPAAANHFAEWCRLRAEVYHPLDKFDAIATTGEALVELGGDDLIGEMLLESSTYPRVRYSPLTATGLDRVRGLMALRLGDLETAGMWLERALSWATSQDLSTELLLARFAGAQLLAAKEEWDGAVRESRSAALRASECGLEGISDRIYRWLESIPRGEAILRSAAVSLTRREIEILTLVAEGETNRGIAVLLHISPHTANRHLSNILLKLGAANRAEAVKHATDLGLL